MKTLTCLYLVGFLFASTASAAPLYHIVPLGFDDHEHTRIDGYRSSTGSVLNATGKVLGGSVRYNGGNIDLGSSLWVYDGATTVAIGLTGAEHTRNDGYQENVYRQMNEAGQVYGISNRYNGGSIQLGYSAWVYDGAQTIDIGLTGSEYIWSDGYKASVPYQMNASGQVVGYASRADAGGASAWLYDGAITINIGLAGPEHTSSSGLKASEPRSLNEAGRAIGYSYRYNGGTADLGRSAWLYDGATTINIGFTGGEHTRNDGYKYSDVYNWNEAGQAIGSSTRFSGGGTDLGASAWLYDGATTINIGLTDSEHTDSNGYKSSGAQQLNKAGWVRGSSQRFNGSSGSTWPALGFDVWLYDGTATTIIGLTGDEHTRNDGYKYNNSTQMNDAGQVLGYSARYNGGSDLMGYSAWLYDGATTIAIGLTDSEHTRNDGYKVNVADSAHALNKTGRVIGRAERYNGGGSKLGQSTWLFDGSTTINIGLTGSEHTHHNGYKYSGAGEFNEAGQVLGHSYRYDGGSTQLGQSVWLYDGTNTIEIGLTGGEHTRSNGHRNSAYSSQLPTRHLNEAGQVIGYSSRFGRNGSSVGQDAWLYDPALDQTIALQLSTRSDGYAYSSAMYLGEDGLVLGRYTLFDALDTNLGDRAFYFTIVNGLHDLGSLIDGGLAANGWDYLASAIRAGGLGQILGHGKLNSQTSGQMAYLLIPLVPGDFDSDGDVDAADFVAWQTNFPKATGATLAQGDADSDGDVDGADFVVWQTHFPYNPGPWASPVPEPGTLLLSMFALAAVTLRRIRR